jgi:hypothetical protein
MKNILVWGHALHTHTHSYIHAGFIKAFSFMGCKTTWVDDRNQHSVAKYSSELSLLTSQERRNTLVITEGQVDSELPVIDGISYVIHNCNREKYPVSKVLNLQVITNGIENSQGVQGDAVADSYAYFDKHSNTLYQPWATDLLPHEFVRAQESRNLNGLDQILASRTLCWIGTIWGGYWGNKSELDPLFKFAESSGFRLVIGGKSLSFEENLNLVRTCSVAPAVVGRWQKVNDYIPCRLFKNISYGGSVFTNSAICANLMHGSIIYSDDPIDGLKKFMEISQREKNERQTYAANNVLLHHTFLNRIRLINYFLSCLT